jgi:hypothetical protein
MSSASKGNVSLALKRTLSKPAEKQGVRVLPPRYVALSKSQKEAAVAPLTELILANMRRLERSGRRGENVTSRK